MPCFKPLVGKLNGQGRYTFKRRYFDQEEGELQVGCGKCLGCNTRSRREKTIRGIHEFQTSDSEGCFITLTISDEHLGDGNLDRTMWTKFMKRVRKRMGPTRFLACGEYGTTGTHRPHFHAILYKTDFSHDRYPWRKSDKGQTLDRSPTLEKLWTFGTSEIGSVTSASIAYVCGYVSSKQVTPSSKDMSGRVKEFSMMSTGGKAGPGGLGREWIETYWKDVWPRDEVIVEGKKYNPPKYYDKYLEEIDPDLLVEVKLRREKRGKEMHADNTLQRLSVKRHIAERALIQRT